MIGRTVLILAMGGKLHVDEREIFKPLTQRDHGPGKRVDEFVVVAGRRGGKVAPSACSRRSSQRSDAPAHSRSIDEAAEGDVVWQG
jgi:hypothetical protein